MHKNLDDYSPCKITGPTVPRFQNEEFLMKHWQDGRKRSPLHLPARLARYFIRILECREEHIQDISEEDAVKEGIDIHILPGTKKNVYPNYYKPEQNSLFYFDNPIDSFKSLWISIHGENDWESNPVVYVYDLVLHIPDRSVRI